MIAPLPVLQRQAQLASLGLTPGARRYAEWVEASHAWGAAPESQAELAAAWGCTERHVRRLEAELVRAGAWVLEACRTRRMRVRRFPARVTDGERLWSAAHAAAQSRIPATSEAVERPAACLPQVGITGHPRPVAPAFVGGLLFAQDIQVLSPASTGPLPPHTPPTQLADAGKFPSSRDPRPPEADPVQPANEPIVDLERLAAAPPVRLTREALVAELAAERTKPEALNAPSDQVPAGDTLAALGLHGDARLEVLASLVPGARTVRELRQRALAAASLGLTRATQSPAALLRAGAREGWLLRRVSGLAPSVALDAAAGLPQALRAFRLVSGVPSSARAHAVLTEEEQRGGRRRRREARTQGDRGVGAVDFGGALDGLQPSQRPTRRRGACRRRDRRRRRGQGQLPFASAEARLTWLEQLERLKQIEEAERADYAAGRFGSARVAPVLAGVGS